MTEKPPFNPTQSGFANQPVGLDKALLQRASGLTDWLIAQALKGLDICAILQGLCEKLVAEGVPVDRGFIGLRTLHPQYHAYTYTWKQGEPLMSEGFLHGENEQDPRWVSSPFY